MDKAAAAVVVILLVTAYFVVERRMRQVAEPSRPAATKTAPAPAAPEPRSSTPVAAVAPGTALDAPPMVPAPDVPGAEGAVSPVAESPAALTTPPPVPTPAGAEKNKKNFFSSEKPPHRHRRRHRHRSGGKPDRDAPIPPAPSRLASAMPVATRRPLGTAAPVADRGPSGQHIAEQMQPGGRKPAFAPSGPATPSVFNYVAYTARFLVVSGARMRSYATFPVGTESALYTHGLAVGHQTQEFKNAVYLGFGTEWGGGTESLHRYELSWQFAWAPLGTDGLFNPHIGFRLGGMMAGSDRLTGGSLKPGAVLAPEVGLDVQAGRHVVLTGALSYDANLGPDVGPDATLSGYAYELSAAARF